VISAAVDEECDRAEAYFTDNLPHLSEIHSRIEQPEVRRWGDVEVETFLLHQGYVCEGDDRPDRGSHDGHLASRGRRLEDCPDPLRPPAARVVGGRPMLQTVLQTHTAEDCTFRLDEDRTATTGAFSRMLETAKEHRARARGA
jgi:hypothetical protein